MVVPELEQKLAAEEGLEGRGSDGSEASTFPSPRGEGEPADAYMEKTVVGAHRYMGKQCF